ncbi:MULTISPECIES: phosphoribosylformylglycinamidine cyclo-ligase [Kytococcus]|uniref:phosphoribosylformylglycinamidine cyclo-ligase n=1 Tax=Kytococcus TaxID=57499 RepID=UPI0008A21031|nr:MULTISPECIES: phosphoribosylformylglycinamidine cyclo-ligase [Kytococcus]OFS15297.1 phosphoribosylformylglycinamidine cyclo-ligase [Kytococcus sp. HMSC28H12]
MTEQPTPQPTTGITYASAGVDTEAGDRAVELMKASVARATRPEVVGGLGGFAGLFDASALRGMERPLLTTSTDGVGTKIAIARALDVHDTIGQDLVAMVVDDIVVCGAEPLFMTDYIATGSVEPERIAAIVSGIARGCELAGVALVGGETAEHPGLMAPDEYDLAGAATGVVDAADVLGPDRVREGDAVLCIASSGLHSNGFSLVRRVVEHAGLRLEDEVPQFGRTLGEELLEPTRIYTLPLLELVRATEVHALSHVTGGGLAANLARVLPQGVFAALDRSTWAPAPVFEAIRAWGGVARADLEKTLNQGVGFVAVLPQDSVDEAVRILGRHGIDAWVAGEVHGSAEAGLGARATAADWVTEAKGVAGGAAALVGEHA